MLGRARHRGCCRGVSQWATREEKRRDRGRGLTVDADNLTHVCDDLISQQSISGLMENSSLRSSRKTAERRGRVESWRLGGQRQIVSLEKKAGDGEDGSCASLLG